MNKQKLNSKFVFKNNLLTPKYYWFKNNLEIKQMLQKFSNNNLNNDNTIIENENEETDNSDDIYELLFDQNNAEKLELVLQKDDAENDEMIQNLLALINTNELDFLKSYWKIYKHFYNELLTFLAENFKIDFLQIYDFSNVDQETNSKKVLELMKKNNFLILKPKIIFQNFILNPSAIIKKNNKVYVIEAKLSGIQKNINILDFIFFEKIITRAKYFYVDCYLNALIKKTLWKKNKPNVQFILTPFIPYSQICDFRLKKEIKYGIKKYDQIDNINKNKYFYPETKNIKDQITYILASRPILWNFKLLEKKYFWYQISCININNLLKKN